jgi:hypothetical protein
MIPAILALGLNLTVAPCSGPADPSPQAAPVALRSERPGRGLARRALPRETDGHSRSLKAVRAASGFALPAQPATVLYTSPSLTPARPAATPSSQRAPPSRDEIV